MVRSMPLPRHVVCLPPFCGAIWREVGFQSSCLNKIYLGRYVKYIDLKSIFLILEYLSMFQVMTVASSNPNARKQHKSKL
jgi:hypothetical protein